MPWLLALLAVCLPAAEASPDDDSQPVEEVFDLELPYPQEAGEFQLTLAPRFERGDEADETRLPVIVEYGLSDVWQIEFALDAWVRVEPEEGPGNDGLGEIELEVKRALGVERENVHLALGFGVTYPLGDVEDELTEGLAEYEVGFFVAREVSIGVLFGQLGVAFVDRVESPDEPEEVEPAAHEIEAGLGLLLPFERFAASFELSGSDNTWNRDGDERELYFTAGLIWPAGDDGEIGIGAGIGLLDGSSFEISDDLRLTAMFTLEF